MSASYPFWSTEASVNADAEVWCGQGLNPSVCGIAQKLDFNTTRVVSRQSASTNSAPIRVPSQLFYN